MQRDFQRCIHQLSSECLSACTYLRLLPGSSTCLNPALPSEQVALVAMPLSDTQGPYACTLSYLISCR